MYKIYKHTLKPGFSHSGWSYVGQTCADNPNKRWHGGANYKSCKCFYNAIKKYGWDNFFHEIIEDNIPCIELANEREKYWIAYYHTWVEDPLCMGYNLTSGGNNCIMSEATKKKISEKATGRVFTTEQRLNVSKALIGHNVSKDTREKISSGKKGKPLSDDTIAKIRQTKQLTRESFSGINHPMYGKHHTEEAKAKISQALLGKPNKSKGKKRASASYKNKCKQVQCIELDLVFDSVKAAAEYFNTSTSNISKCCKQIPGHKTIRGYHIKYFN